ncbi:MAG: helix-turn-helix domain-containing protein [Polyangiaceae bacterium]
MSEYLEQIQRGVDFIETRLDEDIQLPRVARVAGISQWHFQRIFKALTGETLKTYVRSRRLANSLDRLLTTQLRVLDIALMAGFESQESFARAFKKAFGLTPQEYRRLGDKSLFLRKVQFDADYLRHINQNVSLTPELYVQPRMTLVGMRTLFFSVDSEKNNIAEQLLPLWQEFVPRLGEIAHRAMGVCYGVVRQEQADSERLEYHAAIEVTEASSPPAGMVALEIPEARYAKFAHRGPAREVDHTVNYIYSTWLAQSGLRHSYGPDLEFYGPTYHATDANSVLHYAIPIV